MTAASSGAGRNGRNGRNGRAGRNRWNGWDAAVVRYLLPYLLPSLLGLTALGVVCGRLAWQGRQSVRAAQVALDRGDQGEAIRCYRDALRAYVPGSPYERRALDGLGTVASQARAAGDAAGERRAWEAVRVGLLSARSLYLPHAARYAQAQRRLAELDAVAAFPPAPPLRAGAPSTTVASRPELALVSLRGNGPGRSVRPLGPQIASTLVALAGFAMWVGSIFLLIRRGIDRQPGSSLGVAPATGAHMLARVLPAVLFVVGFALFLLGLRFT